MHVHVLILDKFNVQRAITQKVGKPELLIMCSANRLIVLYICVKFRENTEQTRIHSRNGYFQISIMFKGPHSNSGLTTLFFVLHVVS